MYLIALIIDCAITRLYRHNGAMNKSVNLEPGTTEWNKTCYKDYTWSMLNAMLSESFWEKIAPVPR